jgi:hypothetical protein
MRLRAWLAIRYSDSAVSAFASHWLISSAAGSRWTHDTKDGKSAGPLPECRPTRPPLGTESVLPEWPDRLYGDMCLSLLDLGHEAGGGRS